ncbi:MAG: hypothetical protein KBT02_09470 [Treponema sp.]|nr:hypothetical protein [Candidatus Treponema caballi]
MYEKVEKQYNSDNSSVTILTNGTIVVKTPEPTTLYVYTYSGETNNKGAQTGIVEVYKPSELIQTDVNHPVYTAPFVSGANFTDSNGNTQKFDPCPTGVYFDVKRESSDTTGNSVLKDENHGNHTITVNGGTIITTSTIMRLPGLEGYLVHQGNNRSDVTNSYTEGCLAITTSQITSGITPEQNNTQMQRIQGATNATIIVR